MSVVAIAKFKLRATATKGLPYGIKPGRFIQPAQLENCSKNMWSLSFLFKEPLPLGGETEVAFAPLVAAAVPYLQPGVKFVMWAGEEFADGTILSVQEMTSAEVKNILGWEPNY